MKPKKTPFYQVNEQIRAEEVRLIDADGTNVGVVKFNDALNQAREKEMDLVLIAQQARPPVVKITDFSKFKYEQEKTKAKSRKGKSVGLKQLRFKPNIDQHDLEIRAKRAREFLSEGQLVKFVIPFFGRIIGRKDLGYDKMDQLWKMIEDVADIEKDKYMEGNFLIMIVKPK